MRCPSLWCILVAVAVNGCDRVTAPHALELADQTERTLWQNWAPTSLGAAGEDMSAMHMWLTSSDRSGMIVSMDGATDSVGAVIVERVYLPPEGQGMPFAHRSLVAFPQNTSYGILALTDDSADDRPGPEAYQGTDELNPHPALAVAHASMEDWWIPRSGHVVIEPIETASSCPFAVDDEKGAADSGRVTCRLVTFNVQLDGELVRRMDARNALLPEPLKQHHRLDVAPQRVKGIRFTVRCPKDVMSALDKSWYGLACYGPFSFWRSNRLFARSLDVDITQMQRHTAMGSSSRYYRTLRAGSTHPIDGTHIVRWTMSYPDGGLIVRDSTTSITELTTSITELSTTAYPYWLVQDCARGMLAGERRQCLADLGYDPKGRLRYRIAVLDIEDVARGP